jgi:hypothetical protein
VNTASSLGRLVYFELKFNYEYNEMREVEKERGGERGSAG